MAAPIPHAALRVPSQAAQELLRRTGVDPQGLGPGATPGQALADAFRAKLAALRAAEHARTADAQGRELAANAAKAASDANAPAMDAAQAVQPIRPVQSADSMSPGDRILNSFAQTRGDAPPGGLSLRARTEALLAAQPEQALRGQLFVQQVSLGAQAARRGPSSLEEGFRTLAQGGGGG